MMTSSNQSDIQPLKNPFDPNFFQYTDTDTLTSTNMNNIEVQYDSMENLNKKEKRTRRVLSLKERIEVIKIAETRRDTRELAARFECGRTQILSILSQKERLLKEWANNDDPNRLRRRPSLMGIKTNRVIFEWINRCQCAGISLTEENILEKALEAKRFFMYGEFRPNRRWLERFKRKYKLTVEDLKEPNPVYFDGIERSLELADIYEEIKDTILPKHKTVNRNERSSMNKFDESESRMISFEQTMSSSNDIFEIEDSDGDDDNNSKTQFTDNDDIKIKYEDDKPITNNQEALECLKKLEEYSMLKDHFRAIGLIGQLEQIYKGLMDS